MKKRKIALISILSLILVSIIAFIIYTNVYYKSQNIDSYLNSTELVEVNKGKDYIEFIPKDSNNKGIVFYPGGKVEYDSYAPLMNGLANNGYTCILLKMPFNLAVFGSNKGKKHIERYNLEWYVAGHSLGGAFGSTFASKNDKVSGVILLGAYSTANLKNKKVISVYGSNDQILNKEKYEKYKVNLPNNYKEYVIEGGNHAYFGSYGNQRKDGTATITRDEQISQTIDIITKEI